MNSNIQLVERATGKIITETVMGNGALKFAYETLLGHTLSGLLFNSAGLSKLLGVYYDSKLSKRSIASLASIPGCNPQEAALELDHYGCFNDFFTRKLKENSRPRVKEENVIASPADGRVLVFENLKPTDAVPVKGARKTLNDLACCELEADSYAVAVIRLAPVDYHRFHFPCRCVQNMPAVVVRGKYHSVNPIAFKTHPDVYTENTRQITRLESENAGAFYFIEVGAFGVGSIVQTSDVGTHLQFDEKGFFKFGGSTVILLFDNSRIDWCSDLLENSSKQFETLLRQGEVIASVKM